MGVGPGPDVATPHGAVVGGLGAGILASGALTLVGDDSRWGWSAALAAVLVPVLAARLLPRAQALGFLALTAVVVGSALLATRPLESAALAWGVGTTVAAVAAHLVAQLSERVRDLGLEDPLTGLSNRRMLDQVLPVLAASASRTGRPLSVVSARVTEAADVRERWGSSAADALLTRVAGEWSQQLRCSDLVARVGEDQFAMLLPDTPDDGARRMIERIRASTPDVAVSAAAVTWDGQGSSAALAQDVDALLAGTAGA